MLGIIAGIFTAIAVMLFMRTCCVHRKLVRMVSETLETAPQAFLYYDKDGRLVIANHTARAMIPPDAAEAVKHVDGFLDFIFAQRIPFDLECDSAASGRSDFRKMIDCTGRTYLVTASHTASGGLFVQLADVTDMRRRQEELINANRRNFELVEAMEAAPNGIIVIDARKKDFPVIFANRFFCAMIGKTQHEITGKESAKAFSHIEAMVNIGDMLTGEAKSAEWHEGTDEDARWHEFSVSPVFDAEGVLELFVGVLNDKTSIKKQEMQIFQVQKMEALGQLAGGIAHDFNNVLSIIDGYARIATSQLDPDDPVNTHFERIKLAVRRGAGLTRRLLTFGRHNVVGSKVIDIGRLAYEQEALIRPLLDPSINLIINADRNQFAEGTPDNFAHAIMNLVLNARDAMPEGGTIMIGVNKVTPLLMRVDLRPEDKNKEFVCLSVSDTGEGMDEKTMGRIFDPFFTTKVQGKGTGLGLSMIYGIMKQAEGYIDVRSAPGKGATISLYFPFSDKGVPKTITETEDGVSGVPGLRFDGYTALIAEDEPDIVKILTAFLESVGMKVLTAGNGNEALLRQDDFDGDIDLLLTDVVMPELNGVRLASLMREIRPETKVIFISGYPTAGQMAPVKIPDNSCLLAKPVMFEKLAPLIRQVLEGEGGAGRQDDLPHWQQVS